MIINRKSLILVLMNEKYYRRTWEKIDPVDFKKTFVLFDDYREWLILDKGARHTLITENIILQRTVTDDPI